MDINFNIVSEIGVLPSKGGWNLELNLVSWNGAKPKYDLRKWNDSHTKMGKGVTMDEEELFALRDLINAYCDELEP